MFRFDIELVRYRNIAVEGAVMIIDNPIHDTLVTNKVRYLGIVSGKRESFSRVQHLGTSLPFENCEPQKHPLLEFSALWLSKIFALSLI